MRIWGKEDGAAVSKDPLYVDQVLKCTPKQEMEEGDLK